jgi:two-component system, chemotaxis family, protein-glutamate methylesterase/glutaminase
MHEYGHYHRRKFLRSVQLGRQLKVAMLVAKVARNPRPQGSSPRARWSVDVIAIGASAGGFPAILQVLPALSADAPAVLIVQHLDRKRKSFLAPLLAAKTSKPVKEAQHGEPILGGTIYVCPPDQHMLVAGGNIELSHSELVHFSRPSIDLLFESVAGRYGARCMGVILSGSNSDGATGIRGIRQAGGITVAQLPSSAEFHTMPQAAIDTGCIDLIASLDKLGDEIMWLCEPDHRRT